MLLTAWHSPSPQFSAGFKGRLQVPLALDQHGMLNIKKWVGENGIDPAKVIDIGRIPNQLMPAVLREMDVSLQPSRAPICPPKKRWPVRCP